MREVVRIMNNNTSNNIDVIIVIVIVFILLHLFSSQYLSSLNSFNCKRVVLQYPCSLFICLLCIHSLGNR